VQARGHAQFGELLGPGQRRRCKGVVQEREAEEQNVGAEKEARLADNFRDGNRVPGTYVSNRQDRYYWDSASTYGSLLPI
jgi:hypothetical protein